MDTNPSFHEKFKNFINETNFVEVLENFKQICELLGLDNNDDIKSFYETIRDNALKLSDIWQNLDKLISDPVYSDGEICSGSKVGIIKDNSTHQLTNYLFCLKIEYINIFFFINSLKKRLIKD